MQTETPTETDVFESMFGSPERDLNELFESVREDIQKLTDPKLIGIDRAKIINGIIEKCESKGEAAYLFMFIGSLLTEEGMI